MRVTNERQYKTARALLQRFRAQLQAQGNDAATPDVHPRIYEAMKQSLVSEVRGLEADIAEYERLRAGADRIVVKSLAELPTVLIKARVARGWSQAELARRLELHEQQLQRYESSLYAGVAFDRLAEVADVLGVVFKGEVELRGDNNRDVVPWRPAAIAMLLAAVQGVTGAPLEGRTRLQKLLTVWSDVLGEELRAPVFQHDALHYGGFDDEINDDVEFLSTQGLIEVRDASGSVPKPAGTPLQRALRRARTKEQTERYALTREGLKWLDHFLTSGDLITPDKKKRLSELVTAIADEYGGLPLDRLVEELYSKYPELAVNSRIREQVMTRIRRRAGGRRG